LWAEKGGEGRVPDAKVGDIGDDGELEFLWERGKGTGTLSALGLRAAGTCVYDELGLRWGLRGGLALCAPVAGVSLNAGGWRSLSGGGGPSSSSWAGTGGSSDELELSSSLRKWNLREGEGPWDDVRRGSMPKDANAPGPARGSSAAKV
jgi:hypothetical protein